MEVDIQSREASVDGFIDKLITLSTYDEHWVGQASNAALIVINFMFRTCPYNDPLYMYESLSLSKFKG